MPDSPNSPRDVNDDSFFAELIVRFFNGPLDESDLTALRHRLETDPSARQMFVQVARLDGLLTERSLESKQTLSSTSELFDAPAEIDPSNLSMHDATVQAAIREEDVNLATDEPMDLPTYAGADQTPSNLFQRNLSLIIRISSIAAVLLLVIGLAVRALRSPVPPQVAGPTAIAPQPHLQPANPSHSSTARAVVLGASIRAQWESTLPASTAGWVSDQTLSLKSGWVRFDFPSGTTAIIEAPARFTLPSDTQINLELGHVAARVTPQGHGFTVQSPTCKVVDFGTDFGVAVSEHGQSEVQVFQGKVSLSAMPAVASSGAPASGPVEGAAEFLTQGQGRRIETPGGPAIAIAVNQDAFVRLTQFNRWAGAQDSVLDQLRSFNEQLSREPALKLFYSLNDTEQQSLKNHAASTSGQYDMPIADPHAPSWVQGRIAGIRALNFDGAQHQYLVMPNGIRSLKPGK